MVVAASRSTIATFCALLQTKYAISAITVLPRNAPDTPIAQVGITQVPPRGSRLIYAIRALLITFRQRIDIVFCGHLYMAPLAWLIARLEGAKLVIQMHAIFLGAGTLTREF